MPEMRVTDPTELNDSMDIAERDRVEHRVVEVSPIVKAYSLAISDFDPQAASPLEALRLRARMSVAHYYAGRLGRLVIGVEDHTRLLVSPDADMGSDIYPLGSLLREEVDTLARFLKVSPGILQRPAAAPASDGPGGGLRGPELERVVRALVVEGLDPEGAERRTGVPLEKLQRLQQTIQSNRRRSDRLRIPPI